MPKRSREPVYIQIFYPDCGGQFDEKRFNRNMTTEFSLYGGPSTHSAPDARTPQPGGSYRAGTLLKQV